MLNKEGIFSVNSCCDAGFPPQKPIKLDVSLILEAHSGEIIPYSEMAKENSQFLAIVSGLEFGTSSGNLQTELLLDFLLGNSPSDTEEKV